MNVFLAAPFTDRIDSETGLINSDFAAWLRRIISLLDILQLRTINSHVEEEWGARLASPAVAIARDLDAIRQCDLLLAYIGVPPSPGVQFEIGFATANQIPMILFYDRCGRPPYLLEGLPAVCKTVIIPFTDEHELHSQLRLHLERVVSSGSTAERSIEVDIQR